MKHYVIKKDGQYFWYDEEYVQGNWTNAIEYAQIYSEDSMALISHDLLHYGGTLTEIYLQEKNPLLRELLADYAHRAWSGWMSYLFSKSRRNKDGSVTIPKALVQRWDTQIATDYYLLTEKEKDSDRIEADAMIALFERDIS
jgi:hypothetical protein